MSDDVRRALAIDATSTVADRTIDITTIGQRTGRLRRIEIAFYRLGDDIYLSGIPTGKPRDWLVNLDARQHRSRRRPARSPQCSTPTSRATANAGPSIRLILVQDDRLQD